MALLLFSCAKEEAQEGSQPVPIKLTAASLGTDTRAVDGINDTNFPFETPITVAVDGTNYGYKTDATSISDPMVCQETVSPYFPVNGNSVHVVAYHPASVQYATTNQTFTVAADQSTAAGYKASDLMVGLPQATFQDGSGNSLIEGSGMTCKVKRTSIPIPLEFEHKLSKIKVNVTINGAIVKSVTMKNIKRSADFNPSTAVLSNVTAVATTGLDNVIMYSDFTGTSTDFTTAAIIPEQNPADGTEFIDVVIQDSPSDKTLTYKLQEDGDFKSGKQYIYNLTVNNDEILCTTTITDWDTAVDGANYTHGDGLALTKDIKMNPLWYVAEYYMTGSNTMASTANAGYFYAWSAAMSNFAAQTTTYTDYRTAGKTITGQEGTWHLPVRAEFWSIIPGDDRTNTILGFDSETNDKLYSLSGVIFGYNSDTKAGITDISYWRNISATKCRAIRFLGTEYCSAWEYEVSGSVLTITASLIGLVEGSKSSANAAYDAIDWNNLASDDFSIQRTFYARGYKDVGSSSTADKYIGSSLAIWSATYSKYETGWAGNGSYILYYYSGNLDVDSGGRQTAGFCIRLFRDN